MRITQEKKPRQRKVRKGQTISARRHADRARRARRRKRTERREQMRQHFKFKIKVVRYYRQLREQVAANRAVELTLARWQPTKEWHFPWCASSIRQWHRAVGQNHNWAAIRPQSTRPQNIRYQVPKRVVGIIYTLRRLFGWGGHRLAAELEAREIAQVSGRPRAVQF